MKIKMQTDNGIKSYEVSDVLDHVSEKEALYSLQAANWNSEEAKVGFLTGKVVMFCAIVKRPLTEAQAIKAVKEYSK